MLHGDHPARTETRSVADAFDLIDDGHKRIARPHEIGMQGMDEPIFVDRPLSRDQRLSNNLAAENTLPSDLRAFASKRFSSSFSRSSVAIRFSMGSDVCEGCDIFRPAPAVGIRHIVYSVTMMCAQGFEEKRNA